MNANSLSLFVFFFISNSLFLVFSVFFLSLFRSPVPQKMDLETYESDLADYSLQDSPFYEASHPMFFDLSMAAVNNLMNGNAASGSGKNARIGKGSTTNHVTNINAMPANYSMSSATNSNGRSTDKPTAMRFDASLNRHNATGAPYRNGGQRNAPTPLELTVSSTEIRPMDADGPQPTKKKRKCVTFLPNYVQVILYFTMSHVVI